MNRIDRVTAILIQLQSKRVVKAQDIAERFNISLRTVYRDIKTLEEAGIPLIGETGIGYSIMDGYRLPPVMFTLDEATAFLTAEKLVEKLTDTSTDESYKSAMYKIKSVLRSTEKDYLEVMDNHIEVLNSPYVPKEKNAHNLLQPILKSIAEKKVLNIHYFANHSQENTSRNIEPIGIFYYGTNWHLLAFCQLRNDYRDFRIDRICQITSTPLPFKKEHPSLKSFLKHPWNALIRSGLFRKKEKNVPKPILSFGILAADPNLVQTTKTSRKKMIAAQRQTGWHLYFYAETIAAPLPLLATTVDFYHRNPESRLELGNGRALSRVEQMSCSIADMPLPA